MEHTIDECLSYVLVLTRHIRRGDFQAMLLAVLIEMGFPVHVDGFSYLMDAILIKREYPNMILADIYDEIMQRHEEFIDHSQIEQAIRRAIKLAWKRRNHNIWLYFFSETDISRKSPSNKVFISQMAYLAELLSRCEEVSYDRV